MGKDLPRTERPAGRRLSTSRGAELRVAAPVALVPALRELLRSRWRCLTARRTLRLHKDDTQVPLSIYVCPLRRTDGTLEGFLPSAGAGSDPG